MPSPSPKIIQLLSIFAISSTAPTWAKALVLLYGTILAPGRRTVTAALRAYGLILALKPSANGLTRQSSAPHLACLVFSAWWCRWQRHCTLTRSQSGKPVGIPNRKLLSATPWRLSAVTCGVV